MSIDTTTTTPAVVPGLRISDLPGLEVHRVPFGGIPVAALKLPELRQTVREWWEPNSRSTKGRLGQALDLMFPRRRGLAPPPVLWQLLMEVSPLGPKRTFGLDWPDVPVRLRVLLDYPLHQTWECRAGLDARGFGDVFWIAYNMYTKIYEMDDAAWESDGCEEAPRHPRFAGNRAKGKYVWGHDMTDLVFESLYFSPAPLAKPLRPVELSSKAPFIGTIAFGIGS